MLGSLTLKRDEVAIGLRIDAARSPCRGNGTNLRADHSQSTGRNYRSSWEKCNICDIAVSL